MSTLQERKEFYLWCFARSSFERGLDVCKFLTLEKEIPETIRHSLEVSVLVNYGKPFLKCHGIGSLPKKVIPSDFFELHEHLLTLRNKTVAHSDAINFPADDPTFGNINQLRVMFSSSQYEVTLLQPSFEKVEFSHVGDLCEILRQKANYYIDRFCERHLQGKFPDGYYRIGVKAEEDSLVALPNPEKNLPGNE